jgi:hypothetical protein
MSAVTTVANAGGIKTAAVAPVMLTYIYGLC